MEELSDPQAQARTREIVQILLDLHGAALERMLTTIAETGATGQALIDAAASDDLVGSVLLLHGLHPLDLEAACAPGADGVASACAPTAATWS